MIASFVFVFFFDKMIASFVGPLYIFDLSFELVDSFWSNSINVTSKLNITRNEPNRELQDDDWQCITLIW